MPDKRIKGSHNPSRKSLQRWDTEGGAPKGGRAKRTRDPAQLAKLITLIEEHEATIRRLHEVIRKVRLLATTEKLTAIGYENALAQIRAETEQ
jgi:Zn-dependent M32 family carboxypeptidase